MLRPPTEENEQTTRDTAEMPLGIGAALSNALKIVSEP